MPEVHIINHTHWDREWFLTHEYTSAWIPDLVDSLERIAGENPGYEFLLDGQSLVIEDLLGFRPDLRDRVEALVSKGNLVVGPLYSQPDWRIVSGELHLRNLGYGIADAEALGGRADVAWLVDTFGHISQAPQILALAGVDTAFVWRGVPEMAPVFEWVGPDGTVLPAVDLFGGYRNLYGVTKTADIALDRLLAEVHKLEDRYRGVPIPLFDGYDLDIEPEDPVELYGQLGVPANIDLIASSPRTYADAVRGHLADAPRLTGELLSGRFGATFPGSLSARTYLKVLHHDAEWALHRRIEPLATLAAERGVDYEHETYERIGRTLLQNGVHDCICGVSIDQVHERMERSYRRVLSWADEEQQRLASAILDGFAPSVYAVSANPMPSSAIVRVGDRALWLDGEGIGVVPPADVHPVRRCDRPVAAFDWSNEHYVLRIDRDGIDVEGVGRILRVVVRRDRGDTYSSEPDEILGQLAPSGSVVHVDESDVDATVRFDLALETADVAVTATVTVRVDDGPMVHLTVDLDSSGTELRVDAEFTTGIASPTTHAAMPFDVVERAHEADDLLPHDVDPALEGILMGQRETGYITEFPFHDYVAQSDGARTRAVLARGLRSYRSAADGTLTVTLRRSVEWLARTDLELRSGDAGPAMYVPGARAERTVGHELAFAVVDGPLSDLAALSAAFHNPPLVVEIGDGPDDGATRWRATTAPLPMSAFVRDPDAHPLLRLFNPLDDDVVLEHPVERRSLRGVDLGPTSSVHSRESLTAAVDLGDPPVARGTSDVTVLTPIVDRVGPSRSRPSPPRLDELDDRIDSLAERLADVHASLPSVAGTERYIHTHRAYVLERELLELRLSRELNQRLLDSNDEVSIPDDPDPRIAELGVALNELRIKRRIFDYVVQALGDA